jgi:hypothetical protein
VFSFLLEAGTVVVVYELCLYYAFSCKLFIVNGTHATTQALESSPKHVFTSVKTNSQPPLSCHSELTTTTIPISRTTYTPHCATFPSLNVWPIMYKPCHVMSCTPLLNPRHYINANQQDQYARLGAKRRARQGKTYSRNTSFWLSVPNENNNNNNKRHIKPKD